MHTPTYIARYENNVMLIEGTALEQLKALLDRTGLQKIVFKYGISIANRQNVLYVINGRFGYSACIAVDQDSIMRPLYRLSDADLNSIIHRLKVDYSDKLK